MRISEISINRPVFATMMILALLVLGAFSYLDLPVEMFPEVDFPIVIVQTIYPGASAEAVETEVTKKVEEAVNQIAGLERITARSQEAYSLVIIEFELDIDGAVASQDVSEKVSSILMDLPDNIERPLINRWDPDAQPVISLAISGERSPKEVTQLVKDKIKPRLETVSGVGSVQMVGGSEREIRIAVDPVRMEAHQVTVTDLTFGISAGNMEIPGGRISESSREYLVRMLGKVGSVSQFDSIVVKNIEGSPVYLSDVATVLDTVAEQRSLSRLNGNSAVGLSLIRQSGSNVVEMAAGAREVIAELKKELPPDISIEVVNDESVFIRDSIHEVQTNIAVGTGLAVLVIFLFLLNIRPTIITGISIPLSIIATFAAMKFLGFSINFMTLLGLSLAVGILVDDAIVVIENIYRHIDEGKTPMEAAFSGTKEIGLAVMATTFAIMVVFLPVAFMEGIVGRFFYQFGMTVAFAVLISLFIAFTLTPMLSSRWLRAHDSQSPLTRTDSRRTFLGRLWVSVYRVLNLWNVAFDSLKPAYKGALAWSLKHRFLTISLAVISFAAALYAGQFVGTEFIPASDNSKLIIDIKTPPGTDLYETSRRFEKVEAIVGELEQVKEIYTTVGGSNRPVNEGDVFVVLTDLSERTISQAEIIDSIRGLLSHLPGMIYAVGRGEAEGGSSKPIEVSIRGEDLNILTDLVHKVEEIARSIPGAADIDNTLQEGKPEIQVVIDRDAADDLGLSLYTVPMTVRTLIEGEVVTRYREGDEEYDVRVQLDDRFRSSASDISRILIKSEKKVPGLEELLLPLGRVATVTKSSAIGEYLRYNRQREARVNANVSTGYFAGTVTSEIFARIDSLLEIPPGYNIGAVGTQEIMEESFVNIIKALILAIVFIYLLLASQYESFQDPFSIMLSLPLALVGALLSLIIFQSSLSIMSMIGIVMLMGLVTKNAILLIDFVKQQRGKGVNRTEAILIAGPIRLRPILMTTFATVFGMLPLALGLGPGAEIRSGMARAVIGGMISSTLLTMVVVPVVYSIIDDFVMWLTRKKKTEVLQQPKEIVG